MDIKNYSNNRDLISAETAITFTVMLACMVLFAFFPTKGIFQQAVLSLVFLFLVPFLYIKIVFKDKLENFGFKLTRWKDGFWMMPICFLIAGGFFFLIFKYTDFQNVYFLGRY